MTERTVLLTGATGFLGTLIARRLLEEDVRIIALVRCRSREEGALRLRKAWWDWPRLAGEVGKRIEVMPGDIAIENAGLSPEDREAAKSRVDAIINAAADLGLDRDIDVLRRTNVHGVENLISLAREIDQHHGLLRFSHISTAYVCGRRGGEISEMDIGTDFASNYERSKAEGEAVVRSSDIPFTIFRPSMITGETGQGWIRTFNTLYYPLRLYLTGRLRLIPVAPSAKVNMVPGDVVAEAAVRITFDPRGAGRTVHTVPRIEDLPTVSELVSFTREWASAELGTRLPRALFIPLPGPVRNAMVSASGRLAESRGREGDMRPLMSYLEQGQVFRRDAMDELIGRGELNWRDVVRKALEFGTRHGFMHRSERTVHEQVLFRLGRSRRKVRLFDIIEGEPRERGGAEARDDITRLARALAASGVAKGDRVAVVGLNSIRYLVIEAAIGLAGGVSVPLYYTSPIHEVLSIIEDSGAKVLFIGCPGFEGLVSRLPDVRCVSFARVAKAAEGAMEWNDFLREGDTDIGLPLVSFDDIATIRYTSGTTGRPRGVLFDHGNLRWMAETIASLPPWEARNSEVSYLSFLPMNHVVEGILGTYSPYYAPAPLRLHFLEEFKGLRPALRVVRPTVFFSVPRFYEKLWDAFESSALRGVHAGLGRFPISRWARRRIGAAVLRKAGLDHCSQLIVGSAPCDDRLLEDLRSLGIEVHNAYGLTEAPLITLNRVGRNRIGTVGEPLPETEVTISPDGEVLVRGRQVMVGYHPLAGARAGLLSTGDLGRLTSEGSLVIEGRIKEVMITSYGKNIMPSKVEAALRQIPGVVETMLVADSRPYSTALLWVEPEQASVSSRSWDEQVAAIGRDLSAVERPKAWAVLPYDLDIGKGEMTANMKLRREVLMRRFTPVITALYEGSPPPEGVLHVGREART